MTSSWCQLLSICHWPHGNFQVSVVHPKINLKPAKIIATLARTMAYEVWDCYQLLYMSNMYITPIWIHRRAQKMERTITTHAVTSLIFLQIYSLSTKRALVGILSINAESLYCQAGPQWQLEGDTQCPVDKGLNDHQHVQCPSQTLLASLEPHLSWDTAK